MQCALTNDRKVWQFCLHSANSITAWKVSLFEVFLVRIFPHSDKISSYSVRMRENRDQKNSEYGRCSRSEYVILRVVVLVCEKTLKSNETRIFAQFHLGRWILPRLRVGAGYFSSWKFAFLKYHRFHLLSDIMLL